ncbi:MAG TPA: type VI secretion system tube protein Hcp [Parafilimonas sp.]|nr:type VI secretion system tube protein Hcp [Parafilimonas sp.]
MRKIYYLLFAAALLLFCSTAFTQSTAVFMAAFDQNGVKIDGGSTTPGHLKDIEVFSYSFGVSESCVSQTCNSDMSDFSIMMNLNPASIVLKMMTLTGLHLKKVDVSYRKSGATYDYYNIHMENVLVTSVQEAGSSETPTISVSLHAQKIAWQYTADNTGAAGKKTKGGWDNDQKAPWTYY